MTVEDVRRMTDDFITPATAAAVMKMDTGRLIEYARTGQLPFPVIVSGNRVKISRVGFLKFLGIEEEERTRRDGIQEQLKELTKAVKAMLGVMMGFMAIAAPEAAEKLIDTDEMKEALQ